MSRQKRRERAERERERVAEAAEKERAAHAERLAAYAGQPSAASEHVAVRASHGGEEEDLPLVSRPSEWKRRRVEDRVAERDEAARKGRIGRERWGIRVGVSERGAQARAVALSDVPHPMEQWSDGVSEGVLLKEGILGGGLREPTPIQRQAIPLWKCGFHHIGLAQTGSGKTLSFVLPMVDRLAGYPARDRESAAYGPRAVIIAPARELAMQIESVLSPLCRLVGRSSLLIVGGEDIQAQQRCIRQGVDVVVGTPGRLLDLVQGRLLEVRHTRLLAVDEVDRMVGLGLAEPLTEIVQQIVGMSDDQEVGRVCVGVYSATLPVDVSTTVMGLFPSGEAVVRIRVGGEEAVARGVLQRVAVVPDRMEDLQLRLASLLRQSGRCQSVVFCNSRSDCDAVHQALAARLGRGCVSVLHGGMDQPRRTAEMQRFSSGDCAVMVATDVASRGLDVPGVRLVVNYGTPRSSAEYTHRIGRTGRAGSRGESLTYLCDWRDPAAQHVRRVMVQSGQRLPREWREERGAITK